MSDDSDGGTWDYQRWLDRNATPLRSCDPEIPFSDQEKRCVDDLLGSAEVIGFGEMTHGSKPVFMLKDRLLRYLVEQHGVTVIVLEASVAGTREINDFILGADRDPASALAKTGFWSCANVETLALLNWLRDHNESQAASAKRVKFFGCDIQSMDMLKAELERLFLCFEERKHISEPDRMQTQHCLDRLPADEALNQTIKLIFAELDADHPSHDRLIQLHSEQARFIQEVGTDVDAAIRQLKITTGSLINELNSDERFFLNRYTRNLTQCLDHFRFERGGAARDKHMAENILALRNHFQRQKIFMVSGNWHVARVPIVLEGADHYVTTGSMIAEQLGDLYRVIGTVFHCGSYLGVAGESPGGDTIVDSHIPRPDTWEHWLNAYAEKTAAPNYLVDCTDRGQFEAAIRWSSKLKMNVGEAAAKQSYEATYIRQRPIQQFDALCFIQHTTPISVLPQYYD